MMTAQIPENFNWSAGWAVAALVGKKTVLAIVKIDEVTVESVAAATAIIEASESYAAAKREADAALVEYESADEDADDFEQIEQRWAGTRVGVTYGMISGGQFNYHFTKAEKEKLGLR